MAQSSSLATCTVTPAQRRLPSTVLVPSISPLVSSNIPHPACTSLMPVRSADTSTAPEDIARLVHHGANTHAPAPCPPCPTSTGTNLPCSPQNVCPAGATGIRSETESVRGSRLRAHDGLGRTATSDLHLLRCQRAHGTPYAQVYRPSPGGATRRIHCRPRTPERGQSPSRVRTDTRPSRLGHASPRAVVVNSPPLQRGFGRWARRETTARPPSARDQTTIISRSTGEGAWRIACRSPMPCLHTTLTLLASLETSLAHPKRCAIASLCSKRDTSPAPRAQTYCKRACVCRAGRRPALLGTAHRLRRCVMQGTSLHARAVLTPLFVHARDRPPVPYSDVRAGRQSWVRRARNCGHRAVLQSCVLHPAHSLGRCASCSLEHPFYVLRLRKSRGAL
ncbi:hypothetical protein BC628DRAFT_1123749 [Trametes gibbosa]|nr:hypothetical protein BC628DRAFT_1123749 [Trametes gibbosa]